MNVKKSFSTETSERYSRALFEVSQESSELDKAEGDLKNFLSILVSSSDIENFIKNPTQSPDQQIILINILAEKLEFSKNLRNFFLLLIEKRRIFFIQKISESFLKLCLKKEVKLKLH